MKKICIEYVHPPIPIRSKDWVSFFEGSEESGYRGYGATWYEAVIDLIDATAHLDVGDL